MSFSHACGAATECLAGLRGVRAAFEPDQSSARAQRHPGRHQSPDPRLETLLGVELFERRARSIALTPAGKLLHPGVQTGLLYIREAVASIQGARQERILVVSTPPGLTSKWLAPRLYRFASSHPDIDVRISSSINNADFTTDGIDVAVRNLPIDPRSDPALVIEKLVELSFVPVCSPRPNAMGLCGPQGPMAFDQSGAAYRYE